ncbi:MAG: hypothetical protein ND807_17130 [Vicinamibacterales bacterium]|nr:hypothetical protein [Vicinamibacterales bacterium]
MRRSPHVPALLLFAALAIVWTWPLALHFRDHIPGLPGDNFSFLWNLWWMRKALSSPDLSFFRSAYLFSPFGVDLVNHPHTALQGLVSATLLAKLSLIEAENLYIVVSLFLNAACAYALAFEMTRVRRLGVLAGVAFGGSPYIAAHLLGHFDLLTAWVIPLFALFFRRALLGGKVRPAIGAGICASIAAYAAYYHVVYIALFAVTYVWAWWNVCHLSMKRRPDPAAGFSLRLLVVGLIALDVFVMLWIAVSGGAAFSVGPIDISARGVQNPMLALWVLVIVWAWSRWQIRVRLEWPPVDARWRGIQALMIAAATFAVFCLPLVIHAFRIIVSGRYVTQTYFWRSAPRGIDTLSLLMGNPFHPVVGGLASHLYDMHRLDRIEAVGWLGIIPVVVLLSSKGTWFDGDEARRWKTVLLVFAVFALGPFLTFGGHALGLPLPQALARFIPLVENARMPGRAMVVIYLALGVLMALRLAAANLRVEARFGSAAVQWALVALLAVDFLNAPIPLTALDRPAVYQHLAAIDDGGGVIEVPFGIGDGLSNGIGDQNRRVLYYATIHGHPLVGGYIGRMPPGVASAYEAMPVVGNLLRLSSGGSEIEDGPAQALPFRYLVINTATASPELIQYVRSVLDMDLIAAGDGRELYAVQGVKPASLRAAT